jgi:hypothetical protein
VLVSAPGHDLPLWPTLVSFSVVKAMFGVVLSFVLVCTALTCTAFDDSTAGSGLEGASNAWKPGEPIPAKLLNYKTSWHEGSCFPDPRGTEMVFGAITNYQLLREIVLLLQLDARVLSNAVNHVVALVGPSRFFTDVSARLNEMPGLGQQARFKTLKKQSKLKHVVVDSLYITFADMAPESAKMVLGEIARELRSGRPWHDVYWEFMERYECPYEDKSIDGTIIRGKRSKIGNLGDFVLPANRSPLVSFRADWMLKAHVRKLIAANAGDILVLFDKEDLSSFPDLKDKETGERYVLHRVREVYSGR